MHIELWFDHTPGWINNPSWEDNALLHRHFPILLKIRSSRYATSFCHDDQKNSGVITRNFNKLMPLGVSCVWGCEVYISLDQDLRLDGV